MEIVDRLHLKKAIMAVVASLTSLDIWKIITSNIDDAVYHDTLSVSLQVSPNSDDIDRRSEEFIANFYEHLRRESQIC